MKKHNKSIVGETFGKLKVLKQIPVCVKHSGKVYYKYEVSCENCNTFTIMGRDAVVGGKGMCRRCSYSNRNRGLANSNTVDLTGKRFGKLTVLNIDNNKSKEKNKIYWVCKCDCGEQKVISGANLKLKKVTSCGCGQGKKGGDSPFWTGYREISGEFWSKIEYAAKDRNLPFLLTIEDAWDLFVSQDGKCALTGTPIQLLKPKTASLDRIDSNKGYTKDNVQWVHKDINFLKGKFSEKELYKWCELLLSYRNEKSTDII